MRAPRRTAGSKKLMRLPGPAKIVETAAYRARTRSVCLCIAVEQGRTAGWGHYDDELARVDGDWGLASRAIRADFMMQNADSKPPPWHR